MKTNLQKFIKELDVAVTFQKEQAKSSKQQADYFRKSQWMAEGRAEAYREVLIIIFRNGIAK